VPEPAAPTQLRLFDGEATELEPGGTKPGGITEQLPLPLDEKK
jgi:hypothetical protein